MLNAFSIPARLAALITLLSPTVMIQELIFFWLDKVLVNVTLLGGGAEGPKAPPHLPNCKAVLMPSQTLSCMSVFRSAGRKTDIGQVRNLTIAAETSL
jgi:hypothetical protein